jgi:hypothetical protein
VPTNHHPSITLTIVSYSLHGSKSSFLLLILSPFPGSLSFSLSSLLSSLPSSSFPRRIVPVSVSIANLMNSSQEEYNSFVAGSPLPLNPSTKPVSALDCLVADFSYVSSFPCSCSCSSSASAYSCSCRRTGLSRLCGENPGVAEMQNFLDFTLNRIKVCKGRGRKEELEEDNSNSHYSFL